MNKILCLLVVVAVIAQVYGGAVDDASGKAESGIKGEVKKAEAPVEKAAGSGNPQSGPMDFVKPLVNEARTVIGDGEKEMNSFLGF